MPIYSPTLQLLFFFFFVGVTNLIQAISNTKAIVSGGDVLYTMKLFFASASIRSLLVISLERAYIGILSVSRCTEHMRNNNSGHSP